MTLSDTALAHLCDIVDAPDMATTKYELLEEIGRGGMGVVYLARDRELERTVAIKFVHAHVVDQASSERLRVEARILARLEHPGIVPVYDAGLLPDGRAFYAMKHVAGRRLDEFAREGHTLQERLRVFERICEAVASSHAQRVLHRDLKPENVRVGAFGEVLVLDFGVAKWLGERRGERTDAGVADEALARASHATAAAHATAPPITGRPSPTTRGTVLGTFGYMSPEQARGETDDLDERADVFALGAILKFLLTGERPPASDASDATSRWRAHEAPAIPRALEAIGRKALSIDREERYASVPELLADVQNYAAQLPVSAYREGLPTRLVRVASRYKTPIALVLAYLAMRLVLFFFRAD